MSSKQLNTADLVNRAALQDEELNTSTADLHPLCGGVRALVRLPRLNRYPESSAATASVIICLLESTNK